MGIKHLPYILKGWSPSQDLNKIDRDALEEALQTFNKFRDLLNEGKIEEYLKFTQKKDDELDVATYTTPEQSKIDYQENVEHMAKRCLNNMCNLLIITKRVCLSAES